MKITCNISDKETDNQAPVVQRLDNAIHPINRYPADKCQQKKPLYPLIEEELGSVHQFSNLVYQ